MSSEPHPEPDAPARPSTEPDTGDSRPGWGWEPRTNSAAREPEPSPAVAETYERHLVPALFAPWAEHLVSQADPGPGDRVLDLACGTGIVARTAAPRVRPGGAVTAVDVNDDMLAIARRVCAHVRPPITWRRASAEGTGLPGGGFDVVFCQQGLQFVRDRAAACREMYRLAAPGGVVAVSLWCDREHPAYLPFLTALPRHIPEAAGAVGFVRAIFSLADAAELRDVLARAGFRHVDISRHTRVVRFPSARAWAAAFLGAAPVPAIGRLPTPARERLIDEVAGSLAGLVDGDGRLAFDISATVALARCGDSADGR